MAYFPPRCSVFSRSLRGVLSSGKPTHEVSTELVRYLFALCVASSEFDEDDYLERYPDVVDAIAKGQVASAAAHFIVQGFQEGRSYTLRCNEAEYLEGNSDIAHAHEGGTILDVRKHFEENGYTEGRFGSLAQQRAARFVQVPE